MLALASACAALLPPPLLLLRCIAKCWDALTSANPRDNKAAWGKSVVVIIGADSPVGEATVRYFSERGASQVVACGSSTERLHTLCDPLPRAKIVRTIGTTSDAEKIADVARSTGDALVCVVLCPPASAANAADARRTDTVMHVSSTVSSAAVVAERLAPLLHAAAVRASNGVQALPCRPRFVVLDVDAGAGAAPSAAAAIGPGCHAVARAAIDAVSSAEAFASEQGQGGNAAPAPAPLALRLTVPAALLVPPSAAAHNDGQELEDGTGSPTRRAASAVADDTADRVDARVADAVGDAAIATSPRAHSVVAASPWRRALRELRAASWVRTAVPAAFGAKAAMLAMLGASEEGD